MNHLRHEKSPYLIQHANNPVDWYPWGEVAFQKAKKENKPIFLSIGYSTCHWCHVMEHESFEDAKVAKILNDGFISIKVDREQRPDLDSLYMTVCQMMTGQGGWPLNLFLTPEKLPFFSGTYFPKENKHGRVGLIELLNRIQDLWKTKNSDVQKTADTIVQALHELADQTKSTQDSFETVLIKAENEFLSEFDSKNGGFGQAPKFPSPHKFLFLLSYWKQSAKKTGQKSQLLEVVTTSLSKMHQGGFFDHIGGGVHRYSTDEKWILPHFEKMLYDQALVAMAYVQTFLATKNSRYKDIANEIFKFAIRDLKSPMGPYFSAYDADSEGEEGKFYVWSLSELQKNLELDDFEWLQANFEIKKEGNFEDEASKKQTGQNILFLKESLFDKSETDLAEFYNKWKPIQKKLLAIRSKRIAPLKDNKILADWNGLFIAALFMGARAFQSEELNLEASQALDSLLAKFVKPDGSLSHSLCEGVLQEQGFLDDYANIIWACIEAYEATTKEKYLVTAQNLTKQLTSFQDKDAGYFFTSEKSETIITRKKEFYDGATPCGNSVMLHNLTRLSRLLKNEPMAQQAESMLQTYLGVVSNLPTAHAHWLSSVLWSVYSDTQLILVYKESDKNYLDFRAKLDTEFLPLAVKLYKGEGKIDLKFLGEYRHKGMTTLYKCQAFKCQNPITNIDDLNFE